MISSRAGNVEKEVDAELEAASGDPTPTSVEVVGDVAGSKTGVEGDKSPPKLEQGKGGAGDGRRRVVGSASGRRDVVVGWGMQRSEGRR